MYRDHVAWQASLGVVTVATNYYTEYVYLYSQLNNFSMTHEVL